MKIWEFDLISYYFNLKIFFNKVSYDDLYDEFYGLENVMIPVSS